MTTAVGQMFGRTEAYANSFARGKNAMADMFADLFVTTMTDNSVDENVTRALYVGVRERAETIALMAGDPLKAQDDKSRNTQVSKLANAYTLGVVARDHDCVADAFDYAKRKSSMRYTALVKGAVAMKAVCLKAQKANVAPSAEDMRAGIDKALEAGEAEPASKAIGRVLKTWDRLTTGTDEEPSPYADAFSGLLDRYPQDFVKHVAQSLANAQAAMEKIEADAKPLPF